MAMSPLNPFDEALALRKKKEKFVPMAGANNGPQNGAMGPASRWAPTMARADKFLQNGPSVTPGGANTPPAPAPQPKPMVDPLSPAYRGPAKPVAAAVGAAATSAMPAQSYGPSPVTDTASESRKQQILTNEYLMRTRQNEFLANKAGGAAAPGEREALVRGNAGLRAENDLARAANRPVPDAITPQQSSDNQRRSDQMLLEQAQRQLRVLAPDDPMRTGYENAVRHYTEKLSGARAGDVAAGMATGGIAGVAGAFAAGQPRAEAGYEQAGVEGAASRDRSRENIARMNQVAAELWNRRRNERQAGEQFDTDMVGSGRNLQREQMNLAEEMLRSQRAQAAAQGATASAQADPAYIRREQDIRAAEQEGRLATARGAAQTAGVTSRAEGAALQREAAKMQSGFDEAAVINAGTDLSRRLRDTVRWDGQIIYGNDITPALTDLQSFRTSVLSPLEEYAALDPVSASRTAARMLSAIPRPPQGGAFDGSRAFMEDPARVQYAADLADLWSRLNRLANPGASASAG